MEFMVIVYPGDPAVEAGKLPDEETMIKMGEFNKELAAAGVLVDMNGLHPSSKGARIRFSNGAALVTDGPFIESRELVGGYWIWKVASKEEAVNWAKRAPMLHGEVLELRQIYAPEDFASAVAEESYKLLDQNASSR